MKFIAQNPTATSTIVLFSIFCVSLTINGAACTSTSSIEELLDALVETGIANSTTTTKVAAVNGSDNGTKPAVTGGEEIITQQNSTALNTNTSTKRTCACDDSEESLICANNGVTYKNACRFDCAKARVTRLRQVKQGRCSQAAGAQSYWQSKNSG